ncbi:hypothetical protein [Actinacidiphila yeochonensis]|uniref:hypothetical protein n=1 Tax=Actinacidiphila yeochonensis TaxID=89050 RepID=UPI000AF855A5|nr:hypothetical protein [Actinacidiphila yeochonensis]
MAKNRNQNRQQQRDQRDRRSESAAEAPERGSAATIAEERVMPSATQHTRKQQKKFGHN